MNKEIKDNKQVVSTYEWIITSIIMLIPIVNIIMLFIWAFNSKTNLNKSNWAKASLIVWVIGFISYLIVIILFISFFMNLFNKLFMLHV